MHVDKPAIYATRSLLIFIRQRQCGHSYMHTNVTRILLAAKGSFSFAGSRHLLDYAASTSRVLFSYNLRRDLYYPSLLNCSPKSRYVPLVFARTSSTCAPYFPLAPFHRFFGNQLNQVEESEKHARRTKNNNMRNTHNKEMLPIMKCTVDTLPMLNVRRNIDMRHVADSARLFYLTLHSLLSR